MSVESIRPLTPAEAFREKFPRLPAHNVAGHRQDLQKIFLGEDARQIIIVGPCSAWPLESMDEYADKLAALQEQVRERLLLVMRAYVQKPRTALGWQGSLPHLDPNAEPDLIAGMDECRQMMLRVATRMPIADEMVSTHNAAWIADILSYGAVGARSAADQEHRNFASSGFTHYAPGGLTAQDPDCPIGIKNDTHGDISIGADGVLVAQHGHVFNEHGNEVKTGGNPFAHLILRGGGGHTNYDPHSFAQASQLLAKRKIANPGIIVDCSHDNALNGHGRDPSLQEDVAHSVLQGIRRQREGYALTRGLMFEGHLQAGKQAIGPSMRPDTSITDACMGWEDTARVLKDLADELDTILGKPARNG